MVICLPAVIALQPDPVQPWALAIDVRQERIALEGAAVVLDPLGPARRLVVFLSFQSFQ